MMNDISALFQTFDILARLEKYHALCNLIEAVEEYIPKTVEGYDVLSYGYYKAKKFAKAIEYGEKALGIATHPDQISAIRFNLGKCYQNANFPEKAKICFKAVTLKHPQRYDAYIDLAAACYANNEKQLAEQILRDLLNNNQNIDEKSLNSIKFNLGVHELAKGNFKQGMDYLRIGRDLRVWGSYTSRFPIPEWDGKSYPGKHILIVGEGGIGDEIIDIRFIKHIRDLGMKATFASCQGLAHIYKRLPFEQTLNYKKWTTDIDDVEKYDFWIPSMNLPYVIEGLDFSNLWYGRYLISDEKYDKKWKEKFSQIDRNKIKVGIRWSGNPLYEQDLHRTIPVEDVVKIFPKDKFQLYSLQRDHGVEDLKSPHVVDLQHDLQTFDDLISAVNNLDIIVSSCTSVAHVSAALDKKTFVLTPILSYFTWVEDKPHPSWYSENTTVIKQTKPRDWSDVIERLKQLLEL